MGFKINMADVANFGSGFLDANARQTQANLQLRQEELKANRDFIVAQKKDKYAAELELYKEEKKKAAEIEALNNEAKTASAKGGSYNAELYGNRYLLATLGAAKLKVLQDSYKNNPGAYQQMASDIGSNPKDFKFSLSRDMIDKQSQTDVSIINSTFADEMKNAKGDDALVGKLRGLIGMKKETTADIQTVLEEKLKAGKLVQEVVQEPTDLSDINLKVSSYRRKAPKLYKDAFAKVKDASKYKSLKQEDNLIDFISLSKKLNFATNKDFVFNKTKNEIEGIGEGPSAFLASYKKVYNDILNSYNDDDLYSIDTNRNNLSSIINPQEIKRQVSNIMLSRENVLTTGNEGLISGAFKENKTMMAIIPLNIVDVNNRATIDGKAVVINMNEKTKKTYNDFLKAKAKAKYGTFTGDTGIRNVLKIQSDIEDRNAYGDELKRLLISKQVPEVKGDTPTPSTDIPKNNDQWEANKNKTSLSDQYLKSLGNTTPSTKPSKADLYKKSIGG